MSSVRAIKRNIVRNKVKKNRNIKIFWRKLMIDKKGLISYIVEYKKTT
jgi:hypothetical protein